MHFKLTKNHNFKGNLDKNYRDWEQQYYFYSLATGVTER